MAGALPATPPMHLMDRVTVLGVDPHRPHLQGRSSPLSQGAAGQLEGDRCLLTIPISRLIGDRTCKHVIPINQAGSAEEVCCSTTLSPRQQTTRYYSSMHLNRLVSSDLPQRSTFKTANAPGTYTRLVHIQLTACQFT